MQEFAIHKDFLCYHSTYFTAAFRSDFEEARTNRFVFTDIEPRCLKALSSWVYFGKFHDAKDPKDVNKASENPADRTSVNVADGDELVELWILGDRFGIPNLQNAAINALHLYGCEAGLIYAGITELYKLTVPGSRLRAFIVENYARDEVHNMEMLMNRAKHYRSIEFLFELCTRLSQLRNDPASGHYQTWIKIDLCQFHVHETEDCKGRAVVEKETVEKADAEVKDK